jgi:DsbC/DsbD-like thiol-disulfide interchange protein
VSNDDQGQEPRVRLVGEPQAAPVFNCRVIVSRDPAGQVTARAAELEGLTASGASQREALQRLIEAFKSLVKERLAKGEEILWRRPGESAGPGETELHVAVHV